MEYEPGIDCVVVNYRTPDITNRFIESFDSSDLDETTLIVIDNDPLEDQEIDYDPQRHYYFRMGTNLGYAQACNFGAEAAAGADNREIIAFFNSDCELFPNTLSEMYEGMIRRRLDVAGPLQYDSTGAVTHAGIFGDLKQPRHRGWRSRSLDHFRDVKDAVTVSGSAYFIRRAAWEELSNCEVYKTFAPQAMGAFLPTPHYYEETFCSYHAQAHGYDVTYYGQAEMVHEWHKSSPVGGEADKKMALSRSLFRAACDYHGIEHD